jgi:hypothetical protein
MAQLPLVSREKSKSPSKSSGINLHSRKQKSPLQIPFPLLDLSDSLDHP